MALQHSIANNNDNSDSYLDAALEAVEARLGLPTPPPVKRHVGFSGAAAEEATPTE